MATLNLREVERDERGKLVEQGSGNAPERASVGNVPVRSIPSFKIDIKREIYIAVMNAGGVVTRQQIAKLVGRKKTTWLNQQIEELVADGFLYRHQSQWKNGVVMFFYEVNQ